jgi:Gluconate 2-dehydrogenase subunit 3
MADVSTESPVFFAAAQRELLVSVLNRIVPAAGAFPGAGDLGVASYLDRVVGQSAVLRRLFAQGLVQITLMSQTQYAQPFTMLLEEQRDTVLRQVETTAPEFFEVLVTHTYSGYYSHPTIVRLLGMEGRPPQPRGYHLEPLDLSLLDNNKQRQPIYRQV